MKTAIVLFIISVSGFAKGVSAQNFLETKYSINEIAKQRDIFKNEKVKSVTVKKSPSKMTYQIDENGKFTRRLIDDGYVVEEVYIYDHNNLISINSPADADRNYEYDQNGNAIRSTDASSSSSNCFDVDNRLTRVESFADHEEGEGVCGPKKINYEEDLIIEEKYGVL